MHAPAVKPLSREEWLALNNPTSPSNPLVAADAERWVAGSILCDPACTADVLRTVRPADFADGELREVLAIIERRHRAGEPIDVALILADLKGSDRVRDAHTLLATISEDIFSAAQAEHYAGIVADVARKRRIVDAAQVAIDAAKNGHSGADVLTELHCFAEDELRGNAAGVDEFTLGELVSQYPDQRPPVVDGLIRRGETCNIISASKVGKSWLVYLLALSIAFGREWLGQFQATPGRVLLVDNELHRETLASRIPKVADAMGIPLSEASSRVTVWPLRGNLQSLESLAPRFSAITPAEYQAVILDAKYRFIEEGASENENGAETRFYNTVDRIARQTDAAFVMVHHASKGSQNDKAVTDVGAGAGAQSRATDCHLVLRRHEEEGAFVLDAAVRSFAPIEPLAMRYEFPLWLPDPTLDPFKLAGRAGTAEEKAAAKEKASEERVESDSLKVLTAMQSIGHPETKSLIGGAAKLNPSRTAAALGLLVSQGCVRDAEAEKANGQKYPGYELTERVADDAHEAA